MLKKILFVYVIMLVFSLKGFSDDTYYKSFLTIPFPVESSGSDTECTSFDAAFGLCEPCSEVDYMFGTCHYENVCSRVNPSYCEDKDSCETNGNVWCNGTCYSKEEGEEKCRVECNENEIHFISEYKNDKVEVCLPKNLIYLPQFDNSTDFDALNNFTDEEEKIYKRYAFPIYAGDDLVDGVISKSDLLDIKIRLYPLDLAYDLYVGIGYFIDNNTIDFLFIRNENNFLKIGEETKVFATDILPTDNYTELRFDKIYDFCEILNGINYDIVLWYLAFPASDIYSDDFEGLKKRYKEQQVHSIEYLVLKNECNNQE
jgi:hypothetical protein